MILIVLETIKCVKLQVKYSDNSKINNTQNEVRIINYF